MRHERPPEGIPVYSVAYSAPFQAWHGQRVEKEGPTVFELVAATPGLPAGFMDHGEVRISGHVIPRDLWCWVRPRPSMSGLPTYVTLHLLPRGGGSGSSGDQSKSIIGLVAALALTIVTGGIASGALAGLGGAFAAGGALAGLTTGIGAKALALGVGIAGALALGALTAPPTATESRRKNKDLGTASAQGNRIEAGGALPRIIGTFRVYPALITDPYYEIDGQDEYVTVIGALAGPHKLEKIRIGDANIVDAQDIEYEALEGWDDDPAITLATKQCVISGTSFEVSSHILDPDSATKLKDQTTPANSLPQWHTLGSRHAPDVFSIRLDFPQGLGNSDPDYENYYVMIPFRIRIKPRDAADDDPWIDLPEVMFSSRRTDAKKANISFDFTGTEPSVPDPPSNKGFIYAFREVPTQTVNPSGTGGLTAHTYFSDPTKTEDYLANGNTSTTGVLHTHMTGDGVTFYLDPDLFPATSWLVSIKRGMLVSTAGFTVASYTVLGSTYDYFGYYTSTGTHRIVNDDDYFGTAYVLRAQSVWNEHPVGLNGDALIAVRAKNRSIDNVSVLASGYVQDGEDGAWITTSNPAHHYRYVLRGGLTSDPLPLDLVDDGALSDWQANCETEGYACDAIVQGEPVQDVLSMIASCGYARPTQSEVWGVYEDRDRSGDAVMQVFSPRNSSGLRWEKAFPRLPDGFRVTYPSRGAEYVDQQVTVMREGATGSILENVTYSGVVTEAQAVARARFDLAQAVSRGTFYYLDAPAEAIVCRRGDLIGLTHDVLTRQAGAARVKSKITSGGNITGLVLDSAVTVAAASMQTVASMQDVDSMQAIGTEIGLVIRRQDGTFSSHRVAEGEGEHTTVTLVTPVVDADVTITSGWDTEDVPAIGEGDDGALVVWGPVDEETIRLLIFGITPNEDLTFSIVAVDEAPELVRTASGTYDDPGSVTYDHDGEYYFVVPNYEIELVVTLVGGSAGAYGITNASTYPAGTAGGDTTFDGMVAGGSPIPASRTAAGAGGSASGGDTNTAGNAGGAPTGTTASGVGGNAVGTTGTGGTAVTANGNGVQGTVPGAGASGAFRTITGTNYPTSGTGSGGKVVKTYAPGDLVPGTVMKVVIGAAGAPGDGNSNDGGAGQRGEASFSWT